MIKQISIAFACVITLQVTKVQSQTNLYLQTSEMNDLIVHYNADHNSIWRFYSTGVSPNGWWGSKEGDEYNSPERRKRLQDLIGNYQSKMLQMDFDKMNVNGKVDYLLFKRNLEEEAYDLKKEATLYGEIQKLLPFSDRVYKLELPRRRGLAVKGEEVAKELSEINKDIKAATEKFRTADSLTVKQANLAADAVKGMKGLLKNYYDFYNGYDPMFSWWVPRTYAATDSLLNLYASALRKKGREATAPKDDGSGIIGSPIGREEIIRQLKSEFIPYTPDELIAIANKEFAWCDAELLKASKEMGFGDNWKAAQEKVKNSYVQPGQQPEAMYNLYKESVAFIKKNDLLSVDSLAEEDWSMYMMSPSQQLVNPFFLGGESLIVSYPTNTMTYEDKLMSMRGNNPHFSRATVHHELIAGHHLQGFMNERYKNVPAFLYAFLD